MNSKPGAVEISDVSMDDQVFDNLDNLEIGNAGPNSTDLFGYSREFESQLHREISDELMLDGSESDLDYLQLLEPKTNNHVFYQNLIAAAQESYGAPQEFHPAANEVHEEKVKEKKTDDPLPSPTPPPAVQTSGGGSHFHWSSELHARFIKAIEKLGGFEKATPGGVMPMLNVKALTVDHVKTHFQEYLAGSYFADEPGLSKIAGRNAVAPPQEGPSNSQAANKPPRKKTKVKKDANAELKARCEAKIDRSLAAQNNYMDSLLKRAGQLIGNFGQENDPEAVPNPLERRI